MSVETCLRAQCSSTRGRGTKESIAEFIQLHTGIKPAVIEAFTDRRVWVLGAGSHLGFDTRLAALDPARYGHAG